MYSTGLTVTDMSASWISTAFIIYPTAIVNLTSSWVLNALFWFVFYFMLCTLAVDSAFSMLEWVSSAVKDKFNINRKKAAKIVASIAFILWFIYLTRAGVAYLDITDNWVCQYGMVILGILETLFIWWIFKPKRVLEEINRNTKWIKIPKRWFYSSIKFIAPILLSIIFIWQFIDYIKKWFRYDTNYSLTAEIIFWWLIFVIVFTSWFILNSILKRNKKGRVILELNSKEPTWDEIKE
jgi:NSS family neurotransmitter:Na+ symporter